MATKYDVLESLIEAHHDRFGGDDEGLQFVLMGVVRLLSVGHGGEDELADAIYDLIADSYVTSKKTGDEVENQVDQT